MGSILPLWRTSAAVVLFASLVCACGSATPISPSVTDTPSAPAPGPSPAPAPGPSPSPPPEGGRVQGHVIDAETGESISRATVTTTGVCYPGRCGPVDQPTSAAADENGMFLLTANIPQNWRELLLAVTRAGYEPTHIYVSPPSVMAAELKVFRSLTIRPGGSIAMRVFLGSYVCGDESHLCRRVFLESPTAEPLDLEVIPADSQGDVGLFGGPLANHPFFIRSYSRRVTVSDREVWIYAAAEPTEKRGVFDRPMILVAHRH